MFGQPLAGAPLAPLADDDGVFVTEPVGRRLVRHVRDLCERGVACGLGRGELILGGLQLVLRPAERFELLGRRLAVELLARPQLVDLRDEPAPALVGREQLVEGLAGATPCERGPHRPGIVASSSEVDHRFESRKSSSTWATPSSRALGQIQSATALTRSWAFSTAIP